MDNHVYHPVVVGRHCYYGTTNENGERLVNLCQEYNFRLAQQIFPQPRVIGSGPGCTQLDLNTNWIIY